MTYYMSERNRSLTSYPVSSRECEILLDANESFFDPGPALMEEISDAIKRVPLNRYPEDSSLLLRKAFASLYGLNSRNVVAGNGSDELIGMLISAFMTGVESLLVCEPDFSMYRIFADNYSRGVSTFQRTTDFTIDPDALIAKIKTDGARMVIFSNPGSFCGYVLKREDVVRILEHSDALVVVDEAYMDFSDQSVLDLTERFDNLVVLKTCSKALSLAALRLGFAVSCSKISDVLNRLRPPYNINALSQAVGCLVLLKQDQINDTIRMIKTRRDHLFERLILLEEKEVIRKVHRSETNYIFLETRYGNDIFTKLKQRSILVRNFGTMLRITVGSEEENSKLVEALTEIHEEIKESGGQT